MDEIKIPKELTGDLRRYSLHGDRPKMAEKRAVLVKDLYIAHGKRVPELARLFKASAATIYAVLQSEGGGDPVDTRGYQPRLTAEEVAKIKAAIGEGASMVEIAERYGMTPQALYSWMYRHRQARARFLTELHEGKQR